MFIKIWEEKPVLYKTFSTLWQYLAEFFLKWEMFWIKIVVKIKIHFIFNNFFFFKCIFYQIMSKYMVDPDRPQISMWLMRIACPRTPARAPARTRAHTNRHTHGWAHTHAQKHPELCNIAFPQQQWFRKRATVLRYTYIACLVIM